jgi:thioesterase domain-containing protein
LTSITSTAEPVDRRERMKRLAHGAFSREVLRKVRDVIFPLNDQGTGPAIYGVHSITGVATNFIPIAALLGPDQLFFGVQTPTSKRTEQFARSIEEISAEYLERLSEFQPEGDLVFAGHSVGAMIGLEMAQQLRAQGREVRLLVIFDGELFNTGADISTCNPLYWWKLLMNLPAWLKEAWGYFTLASFTKRLLRQFVIVWRGAKARLRGANTTVGLAVDGFINTDYCTPDHAAFMRRLYEIQFNYVPKPYDGRVLVFVAKTGPLLLYRQVEAAWRKIAPQAEIVHVDGSHTTIMEAIDGKAVAEILSQRLDQMRGQSIAASVPT